MVAQQSLLHHKRISGQYKRFFFINIRHFRETSESRQNLLYVQFPLYYTIIIFRSIFFSKLFAYWLIYYPFK